MAKKDTSKPGRDDWIPDESAVNCVGCRAKFTLLVRRHHCRVCGKIFCGKCTKGRLLYTPSARVGEEGYKEKRKRVCNVCFATVGGEIVDAREADRCLEIEAARISDTANCLTLAAAEQDPDADDSDCASDESEYYQRYDHISGTETFFRENDLGKLPQRPVPAPKAATSSQAGAGYPHKPSTVSEPALATLPMSGAPMSGAPNTPWAAMDRADRFGTVPPAPEPPRLWGMRIKDGKMVMG